MLNSVSLIDSEIKIQENLKKIRQIKCASHNKNKASYFCTNASCVQNSTSFLCELCYDNHSKNHAQHHEIKYIDDIFSTNRFNQIKADCKIDPSYQDKIDQILHDIDQMFGSLKENFGNVIDQECKKVKNHIKEHLSIDNKYIVKVLKDHEQMLLQLFTKDDVINNFNLAITAYLESFGKLSKAFGCKSK